MYGKFKKAIIIKGSDMLKKLAKYGNSSALVLDKAILELLGIEEGSVVKIKTDGVSIIITPHDKPASEKISEPYTAEHAQTEAMVKQFFKSYKKIDSARQAKLEKELISLLEKQKSLSNKLFQQQDFMEELQKFNAQKNRSDVQDTRKQDLVTLLERLNLQKSGSHSHDSQEQGLVELLDGLSPQKSSVDVYDFQAMTQALNELKARYSPELVKVEQEIATFQTRNKLSPYELSEDQKNQMTKDFAVVHEKYKDAYTALGKLMDNPEYQHKNQLLAEQFKDNENSAEYIQASNALRCHFIPELKSNAEELAAIAKKYNAHQG